MLDSLFKECVKWGTSYIPPIKRGNEKSSSFEKTVSYKTVLTKRGTFVQNVPRYFDMSRWFLATVIRY
jgi:hypothetical protein